jgi:hypothetical protein
MRTLELADFRGHIDQQFTVVAGEKRLDLVLTEAVPVAGGRPGSRGPFSLIFRGPAEPMLPQATHNIEHPQLGPLDIFIVPIGKDGHGVLYQAIFS